MWSQVIDLTHTITPNIPTWEGSCGFHIDTTHDYLNTTPSFKVQTIHKMNCGLGTHIDAPAHYFEGMPTIEQLSVSDFFKPTVTLDISNRLHEDNTLTTNDITLFETIYGEIQEGSIVIVNTGWHTHWPTEKYHNNYIFPYVSEAAANLLLDRNISGLGIDTLSPDRPTDTFPVHSTLLGHNKLIIENLNNTHLLPPINFYTCVAPLKLESATESPIRAIAFLP